MVPEFPSSYSSVYFLTCFGSAGALIGLSGFLYQEMLLTKVISLVTAGFLAFHSYWFFEYYMRMIVF